MASNKRGSSPFNIKQQIDQIASVLQSDFEASQQELCDSHAAEVAALREQLAACQQSLVDEKLRCTQLEAVVDSRSNKLSHAFYIWKSFGRRVFSSWRELVSLQKERVSVVEKLMTHLDQRQLLTSFEHWSKVAKSIAKSKKMQIEEEKVKYILTEVVAKYEHELQRLQTKLRAAELEIQHGIVERKRLEEKTKTLLLRGMAAMNLDTLQLFSGDSGEACETVRKTNAGGSGTS